MVIVAFVETIADGSASTASATSTTAAAAEQTIGIGGGCVIRTVGTVEVLILCGGTGSSGRR